MTIHPEALKSWEAESADFAKARAENERLRRVLERIVHHNPRFESAVGIAEDALRHGQQDIEKQQAAKAADLRIAVWMAERGIATGHADTIEDLLGEIYAHAASLRRGR